MIWIVKIITYIIAQEYIDTIDILIAMKYINNSSEVLKYINNEWQHMNTQ